MVCWKSALRHFEEIIPTLRLPVPLIKFFDRISGSTAVSVRKILRLWIFGILRESLVKFFGLTIRERLWQPVNSIWLRPCDFTILNENKFDLFTHRPVGFAVDIYYQVEGCFTTPMQGPYIFHSYSLKFLWNPKNTITQSPQSKLRNMPLFFVTNERNFISLLERGRLISPWIFF